MKRMYKMIALLLMAFTVIFLFSGCQMGGETLTSGQAYAKLINGYQKLEQIKSYRAKYYHDDGHSEATICAVSLVMANDVPGERMSVVSHDYRSWNYTDLVYRYTRGGAYYYNGDDQYCYSHTYRYDQSLPSFEQTRQTTKEWQGRTFVEVFYDQILTYLNVESFEEMADRFAKSNFAVDRQNNMQVIRLKTSYWNMICVLQGEEKVKQDHDQAVMNNDEEIIQRLNKEYAKPCELAFYLTDDGYLAGVYFKHDENNIETLNFDHFHEELSFVMTDINVPQVVQAPEWVEGAFARMDVVPVQTAKTVQNGMTYYDIVMLLGQPNSTQDTKQLWREWDLSDGTVMRIRFTDGERGNCVAEAVEMIEN